MGKAFGPTLSSGKVGSIYAGVSSPDQNSLPKRVKSCGTG